MATSELQLVVSAKDNASKTLSGISTSVGKLGSSIGTVAKVAGAGMLALAGAATAFGVASVKAFEQAELSQKRFETGLKNVAKASDEEIASLREQQLALQRLTMFEDDAIASAQGFLATFQLNAKQIQKLTPDLLDMAEGLRTAEGGTIGLEGASNMLGKALQMGTLSALRRVGVTVPGTTKAMQDLYEKKFQLANMDQRLIMLGDMLKGNFEGQARAAGETTAGKVAQLTNEWGNFKEQIGGVLVNNLRLNEALAIMNEKLAWLQTLDWQGYWGKATESIMAFQMAVTNWKNSFFADTNFIWVFIKDFFIPIFEDMKESLTVSFYMIQEAMKPFMPLLTELAKVLGVILLGAIMAVIALIAGFIKLLARFVAIVTVVASAIYETIVKVLSDFFLMIMQVYDGWTKLADLVKKGISGTIKLTKKIFGKDEEEKPNQFGGSVSMGKPTLVGEHRPEVFVPSQSGNIRQLDQAGVGKSVTVNFNNVTVRSDADLDYIVQTVKKTLSRENELSRMGAF